MVIGSGDGVLQDTRGGGEAVDHRTRGCGGRSYVTNAELGVKRPASAFNVYLADVRGSMSKYSRRRLAKKTQIFRFDLLKLKFETLPPEARSQYVQKAADAKAQAQEQRSQALQQQAAGHGVRTCGGGENPVTAAAVKPQSEELSVPAEAGLAIAEAPSKAGATRGSSLPDQERDNATSLPRRLVFTDMSSGVQRFLRLSLQERLGSGSFGVCYVVEEPLTGLRWCAKFTLPLSKTSSPAELESTRGHLRQELAAMSHMDHPNVLRAIGLCLGDDGKVTALLLPLYASSLRTWIEGRQPAKLASTVVEQPVRWAERACIVQVASGLAHMHARSIVHLDMKPENILVEGQRFSIADFGVCRTTSRADGVPDGVLPANRVNSLQYRPLELVEMQSRSVQPSPRWDLWAFGCVAFETTAWMNPSWRQPGPMRRLFGGLHMKPVREAEQRRDDRIRRHCPRALAPILFAAMPKSMPKSKSIRASELVLKLEALDTVAEYAVAEAVP
jgi:serine/threonine protein kinase